MSDVLKTLAVLASCTAVTLSSGAAFAQSNRKPVPVEDNLARDRTQYNDQFTGSDFRVIGGEWLPDWDPAARTLQPGHYRIVMDCDVAGVENEGTSGFYIHVWTSDQSTELYTDGWRVSDETCNAAEVQYFFQASMAPGAITFEADSTDALLIDRVRLIDSQGVFLDWGEDDDKGWCLSQDEEDGSRAWRYAADDTCSSTLTLGGHNASAVVQAGRTDTVYRYSVDIDCDVTGVENEGTGNQLMISYLNAQGETLGLSWFHEDTNAPVLPICRDMEEETLVQGVPTTLEIRTTGSDAALLDQIYVYRDGVQVKVLGESNSSGWCLSTDPGDANGNWRGHIFQNECRTVWQFDLR